MSLHARIIEVRDNYPKWSSSRIAAKVRCNPAYVRVAIQRASVLREDQPSVRKQLQDWEIQCILSDYKAGVKLESIACEFCVTSPCISNIARKAGLPRRTNRGPANRTPKI